MFLKLLSTTVLFFSILHGSAAQCLGKEKKFVPTLVVHGGAGVSVGIPNEAKIEGVRMALKLGYIKLLKTGNVLDAVEKAVSYLESNENFNAGYGSALTLNGTVEMDASIMNGSDLSGGCVACIKDILHPIKLARSVMTKTKHNFLTGDGAMNLAKQENFTFLPEGCLVTETSKKALEEYLKDLEGKKKHKKCKSKKSKKNYGEPGTVGAVAIDEYGNVAAATSTGGTTGKLVGRIGDSPILGSGTYADNCLGAVSATGFGEAIMKFNVAQRILQLINYKCIDAKSATECVLEEMLIKLEAEAGAITIDQKGTVGVYFTTLKMPWAYRIGKEIHYGINKGDDFVDREEINC